MKNYHSGTDSKGFPGLSNESFFITLRSNTFGKTDVLMVDGGPMVQVLTTPRRKWYKFLAQLLSFGYYKAPWQYKVKLCQ